MQFSPSFIEQLRDRTTLSEVVGKQVRLIHKNGGSYSGLCPFHQEKTPSFTVSNEKGFYHCFGCGAHGDAIGFLMAKEGISFTEAIVALAEKIGMQLPALDRKEHEFQQKTASAYEVMEQASLWFQQQLLSPAGKEARTYFQKRGIGREIASKFHLGFAPDSRHGLQHYLKEKGVSEKKMLEVGLIGKPEQGESYDRFRGRIMFPIMDMKNRVIAFGGRTIRDANPKYLNSPETFLFKKSDVLYAENMARKSAYEQENLVVVEGYMDVIALHIAGITTAVAPLGTALTDQHLKRLWHYVKEPIICLDGDSAGKRAMMRTAHHALPLLKPGFSLRFVELPNGEDPDDVIKNRGVAFFERLLASALPLSEMIWNNEYQQQQLTTPEQKAAFEQRIMQYVDTITDTQLQGYYRRHFSSKLWEVVKKFTATSKGKTTKSNKKSIITLEKQNVIEQCECTLMALILSYDILLTREDVQHTFSNIEFKRSNLNKLQTAILELLYGETSKENIPLPTIVIKDFRRHLEKEGFTDNIEYLCGDSRFLPNVMLSCEEDILLLWHYTLDKYHLSLMQDEYKALLAEMTEQAEKKATAYYNQILLLKKVISEKEQLLLNND